MKYFTGILVICICLISCKKEEGIGGTSTITGKVIVHDFDGGFQEPAPQEIYPARDEKVFVIYGTDNLTYDDDFDTSLDGSYEFKNLQKGKYKIFAYSKDSTGAKLTGQVSDVDIPVIVEVEITSNGSTVAAPDIIILDNNN
jgi:hypothetical protein